MSSKRITAIVLFAVLIAALIFLFRHEDKFAVNLKSAAAAAEGAELCEFSAEEARNCKVLTGGGEGSQLQELLEALSAASAATSPGKVAVTRERILRLRGHALPEGQYLGCYRLLVFEGFPGEYVTEVEMDPGCVRILRYGVGSARTPLLIR